MSAVLNRLQRYVGWIMDLPMDHRLRWGLVMSMLNHLFTGSLFLAPYWAHTRWGWLADSERYIDYPAVGRFLRVWALLFLPYPAIGLLYWRSRRMAWVVNAVMAGAIANMTLAVAYGLHQVGSVSNVGMLMYPLIALLATMIYGVGWGLFAYAFGFSIFIGMVLLEMRGMLSYAPIFRILGKTELIHPIYVGVTLTWLTVCAAVFVLLNAGLFHRYLVEIRQRNLELARRFGSLVERSPVPVLATVGGTVRFANEAAARLAGVESGNRMVGRDLYGFLADPSDRGRLRRLMEEGIPDSQPRQLRLQWVADNGEPLHVEATMAAIPDLEPGAVQLALRNLTEEERAEREKLAIWGTQIGLWDWDMETGEVIWNEDGARQTGLPASRPQRADSWKQLIHPEDGSRFEAALRDHVDGRSPFFECEYRLAGAHADWRWVHLRGKTVRRRQDGYPLRLVGTQQDISERVALEVELSQARKLEAIGRLAGGIAHDFNNLLTPILCATDLIRPDLASNEAALKDLALIRKAGERARDLVAQLLSFARKQVIAPRTLRLGALLEEIRPMLSRLLGETVQIRVRIDPDLPHIHADPTQLQQIILNLSINARDAMPEGGQLSMEALSVMRPPIGAPLSEPVPHVRLVVQDTGRGIEANLLPHLFEPFFTTKAPGQGTGLGLASCYGLVKQMGGDIRVRSEVGRGSVFEIDWPARPEPLVEADEEEAPSSVAWAGTATILLVEDNPDVLEVIVGMLSQQGFRVMRASRGEEALRLIETSAIPIDLLITDVVMPGMGGVELARRIRRLVPDIPILLMSGYGPGINEPVGLAEAGLHFLSKPFSGEELGRELRRLLGNPEAKGPPSRSIH